MKDKSKIEKIYRQMENDRWTVNRIDIELLSDEEFVLGAIPYNIGGWFYPKIDKKLRGNERIWRRWVDLCSIEDNWKFVPQKVRETQTFVDYVLSLPVPKDKDGKVQKVKLQAVNCWFEEMFNTSAQLAPRIVELYARLIVVGAIDVFDKFKIETIYIKNKDFWQAVDQRVKTLKE